MLSSLSQFLEGQSRTHHRDRHGITCVRDILGRLQAQGKMAKTREVNPEVLLLFRAIAYCWLAHSSCFSCIQDCRSVDDCSSPARTMFVCPRPDAIAKQLKNTCFQSVQLKKPMRRGGPTENLERVRKGD